MCKKIIIIYIIFAAFPCAVFAVNQQNESVITLTIDGKAKEHIALSEIVRFTKNTPILVYDPNYKSEIEKTLMCAHTFEPCLITSSLRRAHTLRNKTYTTIDENMIRSFVDDIARKINTDPTNAKLKFNDDTNTITEITPHENGIVIDVKKVSTEIIELIKSNGNHLPQALELDHTKIPAKVTSENAKDLGIKEIIGRGESDFRGSTKTRIHNIVTASKRFDGLVIEPNEEFSFVSVLGPVDGEHGYKEELVIRDNETKPEYGGGICQVSTTVFRGAILTGMKITQRRNHSYPVHYYTPTGFDATVYIPAPDFRFINNTPGHVLLNMETKGTKLTFKFYGTNDGRSVEMNGPYVTERQDNGAMKTYFTQVVKDENDNVLIDDIFKSNYKSPDDYPNPNDVAKLTSKPDNWSKKQWDEHKLKHGL